MLGSPGGRSYIYYVNERDKKEMMMKNEFIPYEEALALKELGYKEISMRLYVDGELSLQVDEGQFNHDWDIVSAPLFQQAFRWFREKYKIDHVITRLPKGYRAFLDIDSGVNELWRKHFDTYEEAELACLRKLIEIINQNEDE